MWNLKGINEKSWKHIYLWSEWDKNILFLLIYFHIVCGVTEPANNNNNNNNDNNNDEFLSLSTVYKSLHFLLTFFNNANCSVEMVTPSLCHKLGLQMWSKRENIKNDHEALLWNPIREYLIFHMLHGLCIDKYYFKLPKSHL